MDVHGYPWKSTNIHGYPWISVVKLSKKPINLVVWRTRLPGDGNAVRTLGTALEAALVLHTAAGVAWVGGAPRICYKAQKQLFFC